MPKGPKAGLGQVNRQFSYISSLLDASPTSFLWIDMPFDNAGCTQEEWALGLLVTGSLTGPLPSLGVRRIILTLHYKC